MPYPKNKYRKGYPIYGLDTLTHLLKEGRWVYLRDKVIHPGFILGMTLKTVTGFLDHYLFSEAIDQQKEYYAKQVNDRANLRGTG